MFRAIKKETEDLFSKGSELDNTISIRNEKLTTETFVDCILQNLFTSQN